MPPKSKTNNNSTKMPSMKELQKLLQELDAEGTLSAMTEGPDGKAADLDELYEDSYFHPILHHKVQVQESPSSSTTTTTTATPPLFPKTLTLPTECSWGDDHERMGQTLMVRQGFQVVFETLINMIIPSSTNSTTPKPQSERMILVPSGPPGIGKSCLVYYLVYSLFNQGLDVVISDPMFTNVLLQSGTDDENGGQGTYASCYTPHLNTHPLISKTVKASLPPKLSKTTNFSKRTTVWICDDGYIPPAGIKDLDCYFVITSTNTSGSKSNSNPSTATKSPVEKDLGLIKKHKLGQPTVFQIPYWSLQEVKEAMPVLKKNSKNLSSEMQVLEEAFEKSVKAGNPKKIFAKKELKDIKK